MIIRFIRRYVFVWLDIVYVLYWQLRSIEASSPVPTKPIIDRTKRQIVILPGIYENPRFMDGIIGNLEGAASNIQIDIVGHFRILGCKELSTAIITSL